MRERRGILFISGPVEGNDWSGSVSAELRKRNIYVFSPKLTMNTSGIPFACEAWRRIDACAEHKMVVGAGLGIYQAAILAERYPVDAMALIFVPDMRPGLRLKGIALSSLYAVVAESLLIGSETHELRRFESGLLNAKTLTHAAIPIDRTEAVAEELSIFLTSTELSKSLDK